MRCIGEAMRRLDIASRNIYHFCMKAIISEKGQVTIPKLCRDRLGLLPGAVLDFETSEGRLVAFKTQTEDVFMKWRGKGRIPGGLSVDEFLALARGRS